MKKYITTQNEIDLETIRYLQNYGGDKEKKKFKCNEEIRRFKEGNYTDEEKRKSIKHWRYRRLLYFKNKPMQLYHIIANGYYGFAIESKPVLQEIIDLAKDKAQIYFKHRDISIQIEG